MNNPSSILNWFKMCRTLGIDGLSKQKGCPPAMTKKNEIQTSHYQVIHPK